MNANYYDYNELTAAAFENPTADNLNALGEWFEQYGMDYWNGEYYEIDRDHHLKPVFEWDEETDSGELIGYELN